MVDKRMLEELYKKDGEEFVKEAYRMILMREADDKGVMSQLAGMKSGLSKEYIVFELLSSKEAQAKNVLVRGFRVGKVSRKRLLADRDNESFVKTAYIAILGRSAEAGGLCSYIDSMANGIIDRNDVIIGMSNSEEGRKTGTHITGLKRKRIKRKIRNGLFRMPVIGQGLRNKKIERNKKAFASSINQIGVSGGNAGGVPVYSPVSEQRLNDIEKRLEELTIESICSKKSSHLTTGVAYRKYEDEMRGSRDEIKNRLRRYDIVFRKVKEGKDDRINALDLGCGRGEWLELAEKEYGVFAMGVDSDRSMLEACKDNNLNAIEADLVTYVKNAASNSVDIITLFQVAEHLPVSVLNDVLNECFRLLRKGGAIIVETPNPENMIVGTCNFFLDPTHISKIPPSLMRILVEGAGFNTSETVRLHEYNAINTGDLDDSDVAAMQMASFFNNYGDYAVIAYKEG